MVSGFFETLWRKFDALGRKTIQSTTPFLNQIENEVRRRDKEKQGGSGVKADD